MQGQWRRPFAQTVVALAAAAAVAAYGQQVNLRLAGSLCNSMARQAVASQLVPPLPASTAAASASVNGATVDQMQRNAQDYFGQLDGLVPFNGLYAVGQVDQTFEKSYGGRYTFGFEWELYKDGRRDAERQLQRTRLEGKAQYLQVMRDTEQRQLQEQMLAVEQMRNKLLALLYQREAAAAKPILERRKQELAAGRATKADVADVEFLAETAQLRAQHYTTTPDVLVYPQAQALINHIEDVQLRPIPDLTDLAYTRSPDVQLQTVLADRAALLPSLKDQITVRLYLERNKDLFRDPYNTAGVRVRIPIGSDRGHDDVVESQRTLYEQQKESLRGSLSQQIALLSERFRLKQNDMRVLQAQSRMLHTKADVACYRMDHPIASLPVDADRDVEALSLQLLDLQRQILSARLDTLEVLTQISALVQPRDPGELYSMAAGR